MKKLLKFISYSFLGVIGLGVIFLGFLFVRAEFSKTELVCEGSGTGAYKNEEYRDDVSLTVIIEPHSFGGSATVRSDGVFASGIYHSNERYQWRIESMLTEFKTFSEHYVLQRIDYKDNGYPENQWYFSLDRRTLNFKITERHGIDSEFEDHAEYSGSCREQGKVI